MSKWIKLSDLKEQIKKEQIKKTKQGIYIPKRKRVK